MYKIRVLIFLSVFLFAITGCQSSAVISKTESIKEENEIRSKDYAFLALLVTQVGGFVVVWRQNRANKKNLDRQFSLEKRKNDVIAYAPVLLEILRDLNILYSALVYKGRFCPIIEHRCPNITKEDPSSTLDNTKTHSMSIAQRGFQFFSIGLRLVDNCKKIIFLAKKEELPITIALCREIKQFLFSLEQGKNTKLQKIMTGIQSCLAGTVSGETMPNLAHHSHDALLTEDQEALLAFYQKLEEAVEQELPYLADLESASI